jgi:hypothetical protein
MAVKKKLSNKSQFIRTQPATMSTADVIAKAKAAGLKISSSLVYMVRGRSSRRAEVGTVKGPSTTAKSIGPAESKAAFVRSRPHLSPKEIVEDAVAAGVKLGASYVYNVRGAAKAKSTRMVTKQAARTVRHSPPVARPIGPSFKAEDLLRAVAAELGLGRAIELLETERARVHAVLRA